MIDAHTSIAGKRHFSKLLMLTFRTDGRFFLAKIYLSPVNSKRVTFFLGNVLCSKAVGHAGFLISKFFPVCTLLGQVFLVK